MKVNNWKEIELTALQTGSLKEAAKIHNVSEANVRQRAYRYKWLTARTLQTQLDKTKTQVIKNAEIIAKTRFDSLDTCSQIETLATLIKEKHSDYQKSMASTLASAAKAVETMNPEEQFQQARKLDSLASAGGKVFGTPDGQVQRLSIFSIPQLQRIEKETDGIVIDAEEI